MSAGHEKQRLTHYLTGAKEEAIGSAGIDWKKKGALLQAVSEALHKEGPTLAEKLGKDSLTAAELKTGLLKAATSMSTTSGKLADAGEALSVVSDHLVKARTERASMKPLVEPTPYTEPSYNGAQPTPEQIEKAAIDRAAANKERNDYQTAANGQEADAAAITSKLDQVFLSAIPPMMAIHGGPDPTAPTDPSTPANPGGPKTSTPPTIPVRNDETRTGVEREPETGLVRDRDEEREREREERERERERREQERRERAERERQEHLEQERREREERERLDRLERERLERERLERERLERERLEQLERERHQDPVRVTPITNVQGETDGGATYQGVSSSSTPNGTTPVSGIGAGAAGVAGAAGAAGAGVGASIVRGGGAGGPLGGGSAAAGSVSPVRGIGAGGRVGAPSSLGSGTSSAGSPSRAAGAASTSRSAGAGAPSRSAGAGAGRSAAGQGARSGAAGSSSRSGAKGKAKGLFRRGANGSSTGGRSNKKKDEHGTARDALVYEQDWLGDDTAAPSVLD